MEFEIPEPEAIRRNLEQSFSLDNTKALQVYEPPKDLFPGRAEIEEMMK